MHPRLGTKLRLAVATPWLRVTTRRLEMTTLLAVALSVMLALVGCTKDGAATAPVRDASTTPLASEPSSSKPSKPPQFADSVEKEKPNAPEKIFGDLQVVAPPGARVSVDGAAAGTTTSDGGLFVPQLTAGTHAVSVSYPGYDAREGTLTITPHRTATLVLTLSDFKTESATDQPVELEMKRQVGALHIRAVASHPPIKVFVNNVPVWDAPVTVNPLPAGSNQVRLVRGKNEVSGVVTVVAGRLRVIRVDMSKNELPVEADEPMVPSVSAPASGD